MEIYGNIVSNVDVNVIQKTYYSPWDIIYSHDGFSITDSLVGGYAGYNNRLDFLTRNSI